MAAVPTIDLTLADSDNEDIFYSFSSSTSMDNTDVRKENTKARKANGKPSKFGGSIKQPLSHPYKVSLSKNMKYNILSENETITNKDLSIEGNEKFFNMANRHDVLEREIMESANDDEEKKHSNLNKQITKLFSETEYANSAKDQEQNETDEEIIPDKMQREDISNIPSLYFSKDYNGSEDDFEPNYSEGGTFTFQNDPNSNLNSKRSIEKDGNIKTEDSH